MFEQETALLHKLWGDDGAQDELRTLEQLLRAEGQQVECVPGPIGTQEYVLCLGSGRQRGFTAGV